MQNRNTVTDTEHKTEPKPYTIYRFQTQTQTLQVSSMFKKGLGGMEKSPFIIRIDLRKWKDTQ